MILLKKICLSKFFCNHFGQLLEKSKIFFSPDFFSRKKRKKKKAYKKKKEKQNTKNKTLKAKNKLGKVTL